MDELDEEDALGESADNRVWAYVQTDPAMTLINPSHIHRLDTNPSHSLLQIFLRMEPTVSKSALCGKSEENRKAIRSCSFSRFIVVEIPVR